jgi:hypothetical protein
MNKGCAMTKITQTDPHETENPSEVRRISESIIKPPQGGIHRGDA